MKLRDVLNEDSLSKVLLDVNVTATMIDEYKNNGYVLCYSDDGRVIELTAPVKRHDGKNRRVYAIKQKGFETVTKLSDNIEEFIRLHHEKIELYKKYVPAALQKLTSEPD